MYSVLSNIQYDRIRYTTEVVSVKLYFNFTTPMSTATVFYVSCTPSRVLYFILQYKKVTYFLNLGIVNIYYFVLVYLLGVILPTVI